MVVVMMMMRVMVVMMMLMMHDDDGGGDDDVEDSTDILQIAANEIKKYFLLCVWSFERGIQSFSS